MDINITARNIDLDSNLKVYVHKRLDKLEKLYRRIYKCEVILGEEKVRKNAEIILYLRRNRVVAKESSSDIYASIDNAAENIKKQLRRLHGRVSSRRRKIMIGRIMKPMYFFRDNAEDVIIEPQPGDIVKTDFFASKPMLPEEAKMELELLDRMFIMFRNADTSEVNVVYKREDGNYGLIEPKF